MRAFLPTTIMILLSILSPCRSFHPKSKVRFSTAIAALRLPRQEHAMETAAAPMVAASDYAFRCLVRQHGVNVTYTQMLHARHVVKNPTFCRHHFDFYEYHQGNQRPLLVSTSQERLLLGSEPIDIGHERTNNATRGPLIVQLAGSDPATVVQAAELILEHTNSQVHGFDLNLGCPQGIARKGNYGAFLLEKEEETVYAVLSALRRHVPASTAVSAKIRLPLDPQRLSTRIQRLIDTGIDFLTVHGRTLKENKTAVSACHLDRIRQAVEIASAYSPGFNIMANGGVEQFADVARIRQETGASAVMSSEALLERPNLFVTDSSQLTPRQLLEQQFQFARDYLSWCRLYPPLPGVLGPHGSVNICRGHLFKFLHRYWQPNVDLRDRLASHSLHTLTQLHELIDELYDRCNGMEGQQLAQISTPEASWYRRHWSTASQRESNKDEDRPMSMTERKAMARQRIAQLQRLNQEKLVA